MPAERCTGSPGFSEYRTENEDRGITARVEGSLIPRSPILHDPLIDFMGLSCEVCPLDLDIILAGEIPLCSVCRHHERSADSSASSEQPFSLQFSAHAVRRPAAKKAFSSSSTIDKMTTREEPSYKETAPCGHEGYRPLSTTHIPNQPEQKNSPSNVKYACLCFSKGV